MRNTSAFLIALVIFANTATADVNSSCIEHLGGGMSDVYCYLDLIKDNDKKSVEISKQILSTMPQDSKYRALLVDYMKHKQKEKKYCSLAKASQSSWGIYDALEQKAFHVNDVDYYACVYDLSLSQIKFLTDILSGVSPQ